MLGSACDATRVGGSPRGLVRGAAGRPTWPIASRCSTGSGLRCAERSGGTERERQVRLRRDGEERARRVPGRAGREWRATLGLQHRAAAEAIVARERGGVRGVGRRQADVRAAAIDERAASRRLPRWRIGRLADAGQPRTEDRCRRAADPRRDLEAATGTDVGCSRRKVATRFPARGLRNRCAPRHPHVVNTGKDPWRGGPSPGRERDATATAAVCDATQPLEDGNPNGKGLPRGFHSMHLPPGKTQFTRRWLPRSIAKCERAGLNRALRTPAIYQQMESPRSPAVGPSINRGLLPTSEECRSRRPQCGSTAHRQGCLR